MKVHYFEQGKSDRDDHLLGMAKMQGYVPQNCLLGGMTVMAVVQAGDNPCWGCNGPREKCGGKPKRGDGGVVEGRNRTTSGAIGQP
jgi:hypothetical protein